nr:MAG TPA: hypothetical protein [Caudoviricetes sp.]
MFLLLYKKSLNSFIRICPFFSSPFIILLFYLNVKNILAGNKNFFTNLGQF